MGMVLGKGDDENNPYTKSLVTSSIDRSKIHIQRMFSESFAIYLNEITAVRTAEIVEENKHITLTVNNTIDILCMHNQLIVNAMMNLI